MNSFEVPWAAWFGDQLRQFELPRGFSVETCQIRGAAAISEREVRQALRQPIETPCLSELARNRSDAVVVVEDNTRPARLTEVLPSVLQEIHDGGLPAEKVTILVGIGAHAPLDRPALAKKLGESVLAKYEVINHHPYENLRKLGTSARGIPIHINRIFAESDLKVAVGSVTPHPYAGFGGGAKIVLPGVSGIETLEANHRPAVTRVHGSINDVENNTARHQMEEIALKVGLEFIVNVLTDDRRRTVGVFAGHPVRAHRAAVQAARKVYATVPPQLPVDIVVLNAYPKDTELLQVGNAFNVLRSSSNMPVHQDGIIVVMGACSLGRGYHSLHAPGMRIYRVPIEKPYLRPRTVIAHLPCLNEKDARVSFWSGYPFEPRWNGVVKRLREHFGERASVAVFPCAPLQLLKDESQ